MVGLLSRWSGALSDKYGVRLSLIVGPLIAAIGMGMLALPEVSTNYWTSFFPGMVILGLGMTISIPPLTTTVMNAVSDAQTGIASGINNAAARLAGLFSIAILGTLAIQFLRNWVG